MKEAMLIMKKMDWAVKFIAMETFILVIIHKIKNTEKEHFFGLVFAKILLRKVGITE
jgi:hypothetical protein